MKKSKGLLHEFKEFAIKGNAIELAVGVIIGASFKSIVDSLVADVIMPPISLVTGSIDFKDRFIVLSGGNFDNLADAEAAKAVLFKYGLFFNAIINFVIVAFVIFLMVKQINRLKRKDEEKKKINVTKKCEFCLEEIKKEAIRCPNCTSKLELSTN